jgi:hypothetical protein
MKKILLAVSLFMVYNNSMACTTTIVSSDGKYVTCTVCTTVVICN